MYYAESVSNQFGLWGGKWLLGSLALQKALPPHHVSRALGSRAVRIRSRHGLSFWLRPFSHDLYIYDEIWGREVYADPRIREATEGGTVLDLGAHVGFFTLYAHRVLHAARVLAFEPHPANFALLQRNLTENDVQADLFRKAVAPTETGRMTLHESVGNLGGHSAYGAGKEIEVESVDPETLINSVPGGCNLLKMDCEGSERDILLALPPSALQAIDAVVAEYHLVHYGERGLQKMVVALERSGFDVGVSAPEENGCGILKAYNRARALVPPAPRVVPSLEAR